MRRRDKGSKDFNGEDDVEVCGGDRSEQEFAFADN